MSEQRQEEPLPTEVVERADHPTITGIGGPTFVFWWVVIIAACLAFWLAVAAIVHHMVT